MAFLLTNGIDSSLKNGGMNLSKKVRVIHRALFLLSILILAASLVFFLIKWNGLPEQIGIHFASDGQFDVEAEKFFGFYPHAAGGFLIAIFAVVDHLINKVKIGLNISSEGEMMFKTAFRLTLDVLSVLVSVFFANWSLSVSLQVPLNVDIAQILAVFMFCVSAAGIVLGIITYIKYREKKENSESPGRFHSVSRLIAWMLTVSGIAVLLIAWDRIPGNEEYYFDPDYYGLAYFANFDAFLDKRLLLIPHILIVILLAVLEVISVKAKKANKTALVALTDKLKLISGVFFFWWNMLLISELGIGVVSICLFVFLTAASFIMYFKKSKE